MSKDGSELQIGPISAAAPGPLYQQIVTAVKREITAGRIAPGSALPSFRALAQSLLVSLITVKRAYEELERDGVIYRRQGLGSFVAARGADRSRAEQRNVARHAIRAAVRAGRQGGLDDAGLLDLFKEELGKNFGGQS
jgi:GntR family transcriptional regulator